MDDCRGCLWVVPYLPNQKKFIVLSLNLLHLVQKKIMQLFAESGVKIHTIIASGGIAEKNSLLMQIYADVLNCEIHISGTEQTAALGAAIYASVAAGKDLGGYETIQEAVANMSHLKDIVYKPNPPMVEKYVELYQMYCNLVEMFNPQKNTTMITLSQLH